MDTRRLRENLQFRNSYAVVLELDRVPAASREDAVAQFNQLAAQWMALSCGYGSLQTRKETTLTDSWGRVIGHASTEQPEAPILFAHFAGPERQKNFATRLKSQLEKLGGSMPDLILMEPECVAAAARTRSQRNVPRG